jgi:hypothetical protein
MRDFSFTYVSKICPELTDSEVTILMDELLNLYDKKDIYDQAVRYTAHSMFPDIVPLNSHPIYYMDGRDKINKAVDLLVQASNKLDEVRKPSDTLARTHLDIKSCIHYLTEEVKELLEASDER